MAGEKRLQLDQVPETRLSDLAAVTKDGEAAFLGAQNDGSASGTNRLATLNDITRLNELTVGIYANSDFSEGNKGWRENSPSVLTSKPESLFPYVRTAFDPCSVDCACGNDFVINIEDGWNGCEFTALSQMRDIRCCITYASPEIFILLKGSVIANGSIDEGVRPFVDFRYFNESILVGFERVYLREEDNPITSVDAFTSTGFDISLPHTITCCIDEIESTLGFEVVYPDDDGTKDEISIRVEQFQVNVVVCEKTDVCDPCDLIQAVPAVKYITDEGVLCFCPADGAKVAKLVPFTTGAPNTWDAVAKIGSRLGDEPLVEQLVFVADLFAAQSLNQPTLTLQDDTPTGKYLNAVRNDIAFPGAFSAIALMLERPVNFKSRDAEQFKVAGEYRHDDPDNPPLGIILWDTHGQGIASIKREAQTLSTPAWASLQFPSSATEFLTLEAGYEAGWIRLPSQVQTSEKCAVVSELDVDDFDFTQVISMVLFWDDTADPATGTFFDLRDIIINTYDSVGNQVGALDFGIDEWTTDIAEERAFAYYLDFQTFPPAGLAYVPPVPFLSLSRDKGEAKSLYLEQREKVQTVSLKFQEPRDWTTFDPITKDFIGQLRFRANRACQVIFSITDVGGNTVFAGPGYPGVHDFTGSFYTLKENTNQRIKTEFQYNAVDTINLTFIKNEDVVNYLILNLYELALNFDAERVFTTNFDGELQKELFDNWFINNGIVNIAQNRNSDDSLNTAMVTGVVHQPVVALKHTLGAPADVSSANEFSSIYGITCQSIPTPFTPDDEGGLSQHLMISDGVFTILAPRDENAGISEYSNDTGVAPFERTVNSALDLAALSALIPIDFTAVTELGLVILNSPGIFSLNIEKWGLTNTGADVEVVDYDTYANNTALLNAVDLYHQTGTPLTDNKPDITLTTIGPSQAALIDFKSTMVDGLVNILFPVQKYTTVNYPLTAPSPQNVTLRVQIDDGGNDVLVFGRVIKNGGASAITLAERTGGVGVNTYNLQFDIGINNDPQIRTKLAYTADRNIAGVELFITPIVPPSGQTIAVSDIEYSPDGLTFDTLFGTAGLTYEDDTHMAASVLPLCGLETLDLRRFGENVTNTTIHRNTAPARTHFFSYEIGASLDMSALVEVEATYEIVLDNVGNEGTYGWVALFYEDSTGNRFFYNARGNSQQFLLDDTAGAGGIITKSFVTDYVLDPSVDMTDIERVGIYIVSALNGRSLDVRLQSLEYKDVSTTVLEILAEDFTRDDFRVRYTQIPTCETAGNEQDYNAFGYDPRVVLEYDSEIDFCRSPVLWRGARDLRYYNSAETAWESGEVILVPAKGTNSGVDQDNATFGSTTFLSTQDLSETFTEGVNFNGVRLFYDAASNKITIVTEDPEFLDPGIVPVVTWLTDSTPVALFGSWSGLGTTLAEAIIDVTDPTYAARAGTDIRVEFRVFNTNRRPARGCDNVLVQYFYVNEEECIGAEIETREYVFPALPCDCSGFSGGVKGIAEFQSHPNMANILPDHVGGLLPLNNEYGSGFNLQWFDPNVIQTNVTFNAGTDFNDGLLQYDSGSYTVVLSVAAPGNIDTVILPDLKWESTGLPVVLVGAGWSGLGSQTATAVIDNTHGDFQPSGNILAIVRERNATVAGNFIPWDSQITDVDGKNRIFFVGAGIPDPVPADLPADGIYITVYVGPGSEVNSGRQVFINNDATLTNATSFTFIVAAGEYSGFAVGMGVWIRNGCNGLGFDYQICDHQVATTFTERGVYGTIQDIDTGLNEITVIFEEPVSADFLTARKAAMYITPFENVRDGSWGCYWEASENFINIYSLPGIFDIGALPTTVVQWGFKYWSGSFPTDCQCNIGAFYVCDGDGAKDKYELVGEIPKNVLDPKDWLNLANSPVKWEFLSDSTALGQNFIEICDASQFPACTLVRLIDDDNPDGVVMEVVRIDTTVSPQRVYFTDDIPTTLPGRPAWDGTFQLARAAKALLACDNVPYGISATTDTNILGIPMDGADRAFVNHNAGTITLNPNILGCVRQWVHLANSCMQLPYCYSGEFKLINENECCIETCDCSCNINIVKVEESISNKVPDETEPTTVSNPLGNCSVVTTFDTWIFVTV